MIDYDPARNGRDGYELALRALREQRIRRGIYAPLTETERRWRDEGEVPPEKLETVCGHEKPCVSAYHNGNTRGVGDYS